MTRKPLAIRISEQEARLAALKARQAREDRTRDTRLKVLMGAFLIYRMKAGTTAEDGTMRKLVARELPGFLTRDSDRALCAEMLEAGDRTAMPAPAAPPGGAADEQS